MEEVILCLQALKRDVETTFVNVSGVKDAVEMQNTSSKGILYKSSENRPDGS